VLNLAAKTGFSDFEWLKPQQIARYLRDRQTLGLRLLWKQAITTTCPETMR